MVQYEWKKLKTMQENTGMVQYAQRQHAKQEL